VTLLLTSLLAFLPNHLGWWEWDVNAAYPAGTPVYSIRYPFVLFLSPTTGRPTVGYECSVGGPKRSSEAVTTNFRRVAVADKFLVFEGLQGEYFALTGYGRPDPCETIGTVTVMTVPGSLDETNSALAAEGVRRVSDSDFHTFEELAEEQDRRRVIWSLVGLAVGIVPLAGVVLLAMVWRRK
jgi:hypothetical protein